MNPNTLINKIVIIFLWKLHLTLDCMLGLCCERWTLRGGLKGRHMRDGNLYYTEIACSGLVLDRTAVKA